MAVNDPNFEENVKLSFIKMKEHANNLELRMKDLEGKMIEILEMFTILKTNVDIKLTLKEEKREEINEFSDNSIGNEGVQASKQASEQATKQASTQAITKQASTLTDPKEIETLFKSIPKKQFLTFLTIYQLEEEKQTVTYRSVAEKLNLSESCTRAYVVSLIQKKVPLIKKKVNNRVTILTIPQNFKDLELYPKLLNLFYRLDSGQSRLI